MHTITINKKVESEMLQIPELSKLIGKEVQIKITPTTKKENNIRRRHTRLGTYDLKGKFDSLNIREFANED